MNEATRLKPETTRVAHPEVHVFDTGRLVANKTFLRGEGFSSLLRQVDLFEFPALAYVIEHPEGLTVVDTGLASHVPKPKAFRGFPPSPATSPERELGPRMRSHGLDPEDVRRVVLTHLDWDHTGGLHHFPNAEVHLHRREYAFARTRIGRLRCMPSLWPDDFAPSLYDLQAEPHGPFPTSWRITRSGDLLVVPIPGHSPGQVAVVYDTGDVRLFFAADHMLRADWFEEDIAAGRLVMAGPYAKREARATSRRLSRFLAERPTVLLPSHDAVAGDRLARNEVTRIPDRRDAEPN